MESVSAENNNSSILNSDISNKSVERRILFFWLCAFIIFILLVMFL